MFRLKKSRYLTKKAIRGACFTPLMAFGTRFLPAIQAGPDTMTRRIIIMLTGMALERVE